MEEGRRGGLTLYWSCEILTARLACIFYGSIHALYMDTGCSQRCGLRSDMIGIGSQIQLYCSHT
jgi:hypothetical protein